MIITTALHFKALIYDELGNYQNAVEAYEEALSMYNSFIQDGKITNELADYVNDPQLSQGQKDDYTYALKWIILTYNNLGESYIHLSEYDKAKEILENALEMSLENIYIGRKNLTTSRLYLNLARIYGAEGNLQKAIEYVDLAMRIQRNLFDFESVYPGLVEVYEVYGDLLTEKGETADALNYYMEAKELAEKSYGKSHPVTAEAYNSLGQHYQREGAVDMAVSLFDEAVEIRRNILGYENASTVRFLYNISVCEGGVGEQDKAIESISEAKRIGELIGVEGDLRDAVEKQYKALY